MMRAAAQVLPAPKRCTLSVRSATLTTLPPIYLRPGNAANGTAIIEVVYRRLFFLFFRDGFDALGGGGADASGPPANRVTKSM